MSFCHANGLYMKLESTFYVPNFTQNGETVVSVEGVYRRCVYCFLMKNWIFITYKHEAVAISLTFDEFPNIISSIRFYIAAYWIAIT